MSHRCAFLEGTRGRTILGLLCLALCLTARAGRTDAPAPTRTYTLRDCLQAALHNPDAATHWRVAQDKAASNVSLAKALLYPQLTSVVRVSTSSRTDLVTSSSDQVAFGGETARAGLGLSMPIYDAGMRMDQLHAARAGLRGTQAGILNDQVALLSNTAAAFYALLYVQRLADTGNLQIQAAQEHLRGAQERFNLGAVTKGDVLTAQSAVATANANAETRNAALVAARAHLATLMGGDPTTLLPAAAEPDTAQDIPETTTQLIARALQYSPARVSALALREAARNQLSAIRAERSPKLSAQLNAGYLTGQDLLHPGSSLDQFYFVASLEISLPLLEGPSIRAHEKNQAAEVESQDASLRQLTEDIKAQILIAHTNYQAGEAQVRSAMEAQAAAQEAYRLAQERYEVGKGPQSDVLDALTRLTLARDGLADALNNRDVAAQNLRWATGLDQPGR